MYNRNAQAKSENVCSDTRYNSISRKNNVYTDLCKVMVTAYGSFKCVTPINFLKKYANKNILSKSTLGEDILGFQLIK